MASPKVESDGKDMGAGYGRPPAGHRFQKGRSGNPAGRPRGTGAPGDRLIGSGEPARAMILAEAYRRVTVEEDGVATEVSTHEAVLRAMAAAAMGGNQTAQYRWTQLVKVAEAEQKRAQIALYNVLERDGREREWSGREGRLVECVSYEDDIIADPRTGAIVVRDRAAG